MNSREEGRQLILGVSNDREMYGFVTSDDSELANELISLKGYELEGIFKVITLAKGTIIKDTKLSLLKELKRIYELGWIDSKRFNKHGQIIECNAPQCGGYTLEAELGIIPNANTEPDYLGYEIKQFKVSNFDKINSGVITLITPEPDGGYYVEKGIQPFLHKYGYPDKKIADRINFGGIYKVGDFHKKTKLGILLFGFDFTTNKILDPNGGIYLIDERDNIAASWSFSSILSHWNLKHAKASYIPSKKHIDPCLQYHYGNNIMIGHETDFTYFLSQLSLKNVYYDPAIKVENVSTKPKHKPRSQFRIKSRYVTSLYKHFEIVDLAKI